MNTKDCSQGLSNKEVADKLFESINKETDGALGVVTADGLWSRYACAKFFNNYHPQVIAYCRKLAADKDIDMLDWMLAIDFDSLGSDFCCTYEVLTDVYADNNTENDFYDDMIKLLIDKLMDDVAASSKNPLELKVDEQLPVAIKREILTNKFCFTVTDDGKVFDEDGTETTSYNTLQDIIEQSYNSGYKQAKIEIRQAIGIE